jgi:hypothetical protein
MLSGRRLGMTWLLALSAALAACGSQPAAPEEPGGQDEGGTVGSGKGGSPSSGGQGGSQTPATGGKPATSEGGNGGNGGKASTPPEVDAAPPSQEDAAAAEDTAAPAGDDALGPTPTDPGDQIPDRPFNADRTNPQVYTIKFKPTDADPASTGKNETQTALVDTSKELRKKLVIVLAGSNGAPGPIEVANFSANLGFHAWAIAYHDEYTATEGTGNNPMVFGNSRFNELDGMGRTPSQVKVPRPESVEERMMKGLAYLQTKNPQGDWGYYLQKDGKVRWSDVIFIGHSHGATSSSAFAKVRRVWRAISLSGPRDDNPVPATWLTMESATPMDRIFGFTGTGDAQYKDHVKSMELQKYIGKLTPVEGAQPPFGGTHRLQYNGGHGGSANCGNYAAVCKYMLGVE